MGGTDWLERELLLYDKVGLMSLEQCKAFLRTESAVKRQRADEYEYLQNADVVYEIEIPDDSPVADVRQCLSLASEAQERFEY